MLSFKDFLKKINKKFPLSLIATAIGFVLVLTLSWIYFVGSLSHEEELLHSRLQEEFQVLVSDFVAKNILKSSKLFFTESGQKATLHRIKLKFFSTIPY